MSVSFSDIKEVNEGNLNYVNVNLGMSALQLHLYKSIIMRDLEILDNKNKINKSTLLGTVMQLKECCNHPYLFDGMEQEQSLKSDNTSSTHHMIKNCGKLFVVDKLIIKLTKNKQNRILICAQMDKMLDILEDYCNIRGLSYYRIQKENNQQKLNENTLIILHQTSNKVDFDNTLGSLSTINAIVFYDTDWSCKHKEKEIVQKLSTSSKIDIYQMITMDSLEEKTIDLKQQNKLNIKELISLIKYKTDKILNTTKRSTLDMDQDIDAILNDSNIKNNNDDQSDKEDVEINKKYTFRDILNHPENQPVIRMFVFVFIAMILVPIVTVIMLNKYVMKHILLDWTENGKQNILLVIGVGIAHLIGILYVCYSWSGEDRVPAHILDKTPNEEEEEEEEENETDDSNDSNGSNDSDDEKEYLFVDKANQQNDDGKDIIASKGTQNVLKKRRRNRGKRNRGKGGQKSKNDK